MPDYTPLTDAELETLDCALLRTYADASRIVNGRRAAAEIRALRAQRDDLLAALKGCAEFWMNDTPVYPGSEAAHDALAAIGRALDARAEGRAEGRNGECPTCHGTGADPLSDNLNWLPCKACEGRN